MTTHSSILAWRIPRTEGPGRLQYKGLKELDMTEAAEHRIVYNLSLSPTLLPEKNLKAIFT